MIKKNSNSLRCRQCDMVNWATDEYCRRCHQLLGGSSTESGSTPNRFNLYLAIFIAGLVIPIVVGMMNPTVGAGLATFFLIAALILIVACNVSLLVDMFRVSIMWGLAGFFLAPLSTLLFIAMYWDRAKGKIMASLAATAYCFIIFLGMSQVVRPNTAQKTAASQPTPTPMTKYLDEKPTPQPDVFQPRKDLLRKNSPANNSLKTK